MPNIKFDVDAAIARLGTAEAEGIERLQRYAKELVDELRTVDAALRFVAEKHDERASPISIDVPETDTILYSHSYANLNVSSPVQVDVTAYGQRLASLGNATFEPNNRYAFLLVVRKIGKRDEGDD